MKTTTRALLVGAILACGVGFGTMAQDVPPQPETEAAAVEDAMETLAGLTGSDRPEDMIYARRLVMTMIGQRIYTLSLMGIPGAEYHRDIAENDLLDIGFLLNIFPHLFAPETNTMPPEDLAGDLYVTNARPEIWEDFDTFYDRAITAGETAFAALGASEGDEFVNAIADLQFACDSCHNDYRRTRSTYGIPIPPLE